MVEEFVHGLRTLPGDEFAKLYIEILRKYPASRSVLTLSSIGITPNLSSLKEIYSTISPQLKESYYGKRIARQIVFLEGDTLFTNSMLPAWNSTNLEPIIKDSSKYNLVVFSASWCGPCHKQIPVLKEIYNYIHEYLEIVYVSIDELETLEVWKALMRKEKIPWRSVLAVNDVKEVQDKYDAKAIPLTLLVMPDGRK